MVHLLFVCDGKRDFVTLPRIVETILGDIVKGESRPWARLHKKGYDEKLLFAFRSAKNLEVQGLIATVDRDKAKKRERLGILKDARERYRNDERYFPTALGEADPHGEAWLLDDAVAIRQTLQLSETVSIPSVKRTPSPKKSVDELIEQNRTGDKSHMDILSDIAQSVDPVRYANAKTTGFSDFRSEVMSEIAPLVNNT